MWRGLGVRVEGPAQGEGLGNRVAQTLGVTQERQSGCCTRIVQPDRAGAGSCTAGRRSVLTDRQDHDRPSQLGPTMPVPWHGTGGTCVYSRPSATAICSGRLHSACRLVHRLTTLQVRAQCWACEGPRRAAMLWGMRCLGLRCQQCVHAAWCGCQDLHSACSAAGRNAAAGSQGLPVSVDRHQGLHRARVVAVQGTGADQQRLAEDDCGQPRARLAGQAPLPQAVLRAEHPLQGTRLCQSVPGAPPTGCTIPRTQACHSEHAQQARRALPRLPAC